MATQPYMEEPVTSSGNTEEVDAVEEFHDAPTPRRWYLGSDMGKKLVGVVILVLIAAAAWYVYHRRATQVGDGSVRFDDTSALTDEAKSTPSESSSIVTTPSDTTKRNIVQPTTNVQPPITGSVTSAVAPIATPAATAPATDSISANPTNGMAFTGSGKYQVYRQGNLTWRVDTETGRTCILFATMEEWRKPIVYQHGCNNS
jgi:cytoskeletal protein RodZ